MSLPLPFVSSRTVERLSDESKEATVLDRLRNLHALMLSATQPLAQIPPLFARVTVGLVFVSTGWGKLQHLDRTIAFFQSLGIPAPEYQAPFVAATELTCGLLLVLGVATRFAAVPLISTMVVAIATALWSELEGAIDLFGREEFLFIVVLVWIAIAGAGALSLDAVFARMLRTARAPTRGGDIVGSRHREAVRP